MKKSESRIRNVQVGCCGFGMSRSKYFRSFSTVEVQQTFYEPPKKLTLQKWRAEVDDEFDFAVKAWQLITHTSASPTYRRLKTSLSQEDAEHAGNFKPTAIVEEAWKVTVDRAIALKANRILFQCPASFKPTDENLKNMHLFFGAIERPDNVLLCWEPRGAAWTTDVVDMLCAELKLVHVVDPFVSTTVTPSNFYFRLHGISGWRHKYSDVELDDLLKLVPSVGNGCVFFNNITMAEDALRFRTKLE